MLKILGLVAILSAAIFAASMIGLMIGYSWQPPAQEGNQQAAAEYENKQQYREQKEPFWQRATTDPVAAFTLWLVIFTAVLGITSVLQYGSLIRGEATSAANAKAAKEAVEIAQRSMVASERPWVQVRINLGPNGVTFDDNGVGVDLVFTLKNTGKTPAIGVGIEGGPKLAGDVNNRMSDLENICSTARKEPFNPKRIGYTIFPNDTLVFRMTYGFADKATLAKAAIFPGDTFIMPVVIGCADYFTTLNDGVHHQSRFVYDLYWPIPGGGVRAVPTSKGNMSAAELRLDSWLEAGSFQAD